MATIFRTLIPDGIRFYYLSTSEVPNDKILESLCKMRLRETDQLQIVLAMNEQEINQDRSRPSCEKLKTMVKRCIDQKIRTQKFQARNERNKTAVLVKTRKGNVSVEWKSGECRGKQTYSVQKEKLAASATTAPQSSSLAPRPQTQSDGKTFRNGSLPEAVSCFSGRTHQRACINVISGTLSYVKITDLNRDANLARSASPSTKRLTGSLTRSRRKVVEKDLLPY